MTGAGLPSLRTRLGRLVMGLAVVWLGIVGTALWAVLSHEVNELLDDGLLTTASALSQVLSNAPETVPSLGSMGWDHASFVWQVLDGDGQLRLRSPAAPQQPLVDRPAAGFISGPPDWRVHGSSLADGRWLLVGQRSAERLEAAIEVADLPIGVALVVGLAGLAWLRWRMRHALQPLAALREVLAGYDPLASQPRLPLPACAELAPVHEAVADLGRRLTERVAAESAFTAHAAHALRTPLAAFDAQLAVALREAPPELRPRLARLREASGRLAHVVVALLALFRSGSEPRLAAVDVAAMLEEMHLPGLQLQVHGRSVERADADLLAAALINLLDNAQRHGARLVQIEVGPDHVSLHDDGPGVDARRLDELRSALARGSPTGQVRGVETTGLGLALADRVARVHGGRLELLAVRRGFAVALWLAPEPPGVRGSSAVVA